MVAIYKCRLCGQEIETVHAGNWGAEKITFSFILNDPSVQNGVRGQRIYNQALHYCEDGSFGLADFLGFKMEEIDKGEVDGQ